MSKVVHFANLRLFSFLFFPLLVLFHLSHRCDKQLLSSLIFQSIVQPSPCRRARRRGSGAREPRPTSVGDAGRYNSARNVVSPFERSRHPTTIDAVKIRFGSYPPPLTLLPCKRDVDFWFGLADTTTQPSPSYRTVKVDAIIHHESGQMCHIGTL